MSRRGVTLLELLMALAILPGVVLVGLAIVSGASMEVRRTTRALEEGRLNGNVSSFLAFELADASAVEISLTGGAQLNMRRRIGNGAICGGSSRVVLVAQADWSALRAPDPTRDDARLLDASGFWSSASIVSAGSGHCPDGRIATRISVDRDLPTVTYLRVREAVRVAIYQSGAADWFGIAPADGSSSIQPFAGPLLRGSGRMTLLPSALQIVGQSLRGSGVSLLVPLAP